ncbi:2-oxo acid dehydrogenase subunit E2 [Streptomyces turgidiscabies]|uniref:Dihydrolipoamide acetyltransferase component of pyruvate dehydrogenase complex n=1 Tax=Streptomyces turgidiscabies (strain Car8) TaxID=698760 RepID=L7ERJ1_STRT8|nr:MULTISPECIES: 2-oxo acid dehydrogenase subunit E2 [Streptomyces]ELP62033.1 transketolase, pyridine binding domain protein [Streptomyces turgidiscabies Car8]MDX3498969.1 2-oxo acid dehydrogenase subunit E2 [Streptomyces turgidiscabies]GAQ73416.1 3-methyl-2-oxobutanoate dehydrogenase subunit [Streptomyces turgidiscabies]
MAATAMAQALNTALRDALDADERVVVFGEDVGRLGGVFRVTDGLTDTFGDRRCFDTPVAEAGIAGLAVGMAMAGFRPVVEMQFDAFAYPAFEQIASHMAKFRNRTRGALALPLVVRIPYGGGIGGVEHHSDSSEAYYTHTAGLKVVTPATVADAYSLLREAIEDPDPVVFLEPKRHYWTKEDIELPVRAEPFGTAAVRRPGTDATLVAYGPSVAVALAAASQAAAEGLDVEVLDLRTLVPLDDHALTASVRRTGRCLVVHEAQGFAGVGAEIAARVQERCFDALRAPVLRVTGLDIPYPPPLLESAHLPGVGRVLASLRRLLPDGGRGVRRPVPQAPVEPAADSRTFLLPDLGEGLVEAEVLEWTVAVGDSVTHDQTVVEVETAKSVISLPSPFAGTVTALHCPAGEMVKVGAPLLSVAEAAPENDSGAVLTGYGTGGARRAMSNGAPTLVEQGSRGSQWSDAATAAREPGLRIPLDAAAEKFVRGHRGTPAVTIWADADATALLAARDALGTGLLPLLAGACLAGLAAFPQLNSRVDDIRSEIVRLPQVHLGFAAQTDDGLVVPVVRDADRLPPADLAAELRRLTGLARRGELPAAHRTGGTFTLNNYGVLGVDGATPILNHPQTAMLGVGRLVERPWAVDGRVEVREVVNLSLTFDHRVCDGGTAAGFLRHVIDGITAL